MQTLTQTTRPAATLGSLALRLLDRLAGIDARYREGCRIAKLSDETLRDIGLTRADLDRDRHGA